jgi:flagellar motor switch protein FliN/FliY
VAGTRPALPKWLGDEFTSLLAGIFETMAGERPLIEWETAAAPAEVTMHWWQPFSGVEGSVWIAAAEKDWRGTADHVLRGAGIEENDDASLKSTFLEVAGQAFSGLAQELSGRLGREILPGGGEEMAAASTDAAWISTHLKMGTDEFVLMIGIEDRLLEALAAADSAPPAVTDSEPSPGGTSIPAPGHAESKTFELLLEVELPVSVSFGRAQIPLKDVLMLTTGSVVELNRSVSEPVEVIVNNCVIARGEVVVVEGNFGVRIQQVISRKERLRTLN